MANDYIGRFSGAQIDSLLDKVNAGIYTKTETDALLSEKANSADVSDELEALSAGLIGGAPSSMNTLGKIAGKLTADEALISGHTSRIEEQASDISELQDAAENYSEGYIYLTTGMAKTIQLKPSSSYIVFLTSASKITMFFINTTTSASYLKTIVDQIETITVVRNDLEISFTSTDAITLFARKLN